MTTTPTISIRDAHETDLPSILDIYNHAVIHSTATADYEPRSLEDRAAWYKDRRTKGFPIVVAEDSVGVIVGWGALNPYHARIGYSHTSENSVYVAHDWRGKGVGKALLAELVKRAETLKLHAIVAAIDGDNAASIALHARFGFEHSGRLPQIVRKFDRWLDVVYMVKIFPASDE